jgi:hypothetical protein
MEERKKWAAETLGILTEYLRQTRFAHAAELAQSRRYLEARLVLSPNGRLPTEPRELDLLARIAVRQKKYDQAGRLWEFALRYSPDDETYKRAIQGIIAAKRDRERYRLVLVNVLAAALAAGIALAVLQFGPWHRLASESRKQSPPTPLSVHKQ